MIGVMLTRDGFPIGHEVFPGDASEAETFRVALDSEEAVQLEAGDPRH